MSNAQQISFGPAPAVSQFQQADAGGLAFGDIDGDGDLDFIATGSGPSQGIKTTIYTNDGLGNFTEVTGDPFIDVFSSTANFEDLDGDGDLDLFITGSTSWPTSTTHVYLNDGAGNFTIMTGTSFQITAGADVDFGDVDGDGDLDILLSGYIPQTGNNPQAGFTSLYVNDGSANFSVSTTAVFDSIRASAVAFIDIDNDNHLDLIFSGLKNDNSFTSQIHSNDGTGAFTLFSNTATDATENGDISIADTDNDGDFDILISGSKADGSIISYLYTNDGSGVFTVVNPTQFPGVSFLSSSNFADFDNDGDWDLLLVGSGLGGLSNNSIISNVYENIGGNNFVIADSLIGAYLSCNAIGDVNGDSLLDVVIGGTTIGTPIRATHLFLSTSQNFLSVNSLDKSEPITIFPVPAETEINLTSTDKITLIKIYSLSGQLVLSQNELTNTALLPISHLENGTYIAKIQTENGLQTHKIVKN